MGGGSLMDVYTISIPNARKFTVGGKKIASLDAYMDISVMTGNKMWAPTWDMVYRVKDYRMSHEDYIREYEKMMELSIHNNADEFNKLMNMEKVILACYCGIREFCHRFIFADVLVDHGANYQGEVVTFKPVYCNNCIYNQERQDFGNDPITYKCTHPKNTIPVKFIGTRKPIDNTCPLKFKVI
jgi:hypothetical protein